MSFGALYEIVIIPFFHRRTTGCFTHAPAQGNDILAIIPFLHRCDFLTGWGAGQSGQGAEMLVRVSLTFSDPATLQVRGCRNSPRRSSAADSDWNRNPVQWDFRRKRRIRIFLTKEESIGRIIAVCREIQSAG